jgi:drug/metabolite transporter (DMT)-like permease
VPGNSSTAPEPALGSFRFTHNQSLLLVFCCTLFGGVAQYLFKKSTTHAVFTLAGGGVNWMAILTNYPLWLGLACYGIFTLLITLALRDGELSVLYPVLSLTYIWVVVLSVLVLHEPLTAWKIAGVSLICIGVAFLGMGGKKSAQ